MMKIRILCMALAAGCLLALAGCQERQRSSGEAGEQSSSASSMEPLQSGVPEQSSEPEQSSLSPEEENPWVTVLQEYKVPNSYGISDIVGNRALLYIPGYSEDKDYAGLEVVEMDLTSGELTNFGVGSSYGVAAGWGDDTYWIGVEIQTYEYKLHDEYGYYSDEEVYTNTDDVDTGIYRKSKNGPEEMIYTLPPIEEGFRTISQLTAEDGYLVWTERWETEGEEPYHCIRAMDLRTGEVTLIAKEKDGDSCYYHKIKVIDGQLLYWDYDYRELQEIQLHLYDLATGEDTVFEPPVPVFSPADADYDGRRLVWSSPFSIVDGRPFSEDPHSFWIYDTETGEAKAWDIFPEGEDELEKVKAMEWIGERYLLCVRYVLQYETYILAQLIDLETGEIVYNSVDGHAEYDYPTDFAFDNRTNRLILKWPVPEEKQSSLIVLQVNG